MSPQEDDVLDGFVDDVVEQFLAGLRKGRPTVTIVAIASIYIKELGVEILLGPVADPFIHRIWNKYAG